MQLDTIAKLGNLSSWEAKAEKEFEVSLSYALKPVSKQMTQVQIRKQLVAKGQKDLQSSLPIYR